MAKIVGGVTPTTKAEQIILEFLYENKGREFGAADLEELTGIRADLIHHIMDNLRWKGFSVCSDRRRGVHWFPKNSFIGMGVICALILFVAFMLFTTFDKQAKECPGCPDDTAKQAIIDQEYREKISK